MDPDAIGAAGVRRTDQCPAGEQMTRRRSPPRLANRPSRRSAKRWLRCRGASGRMPVFTGGRVPVGKKWRRRGPLRPGTGRVGYGYGRPGLRRDQAETLIGRRRRGRVFRRRPPSGGDAEVATQAETLSSARPDASCGSPTQATRQPRASRPPSGEKWVQLDDPAGPSLVRRQPQAMQVTGPPATDAVPRGQAGWGSDGWIIGLPSSVTRGRPPGAEAPGSPASVPARRADVGAEPVAVRLRTSTRRGGPPACATRRTTRAEPSASIPLGSCRVREPRSSRMRRATRRRDRRRSRAWSTARPRRRCRSRSPTARR